MRPRRHRSDSPYVRAFAGAALAASLTAVALIRGGVDWRVDLVVSAVAIGTSAIMLWRHSRRVPSVSIAFAGVIVFQAFQLLPVPPAVHAFSPPARRVFEVALGPLHLYPASRPLTLDPAASAGAIVTAVSLLLVFVAASTCAVGVHRKNAAARAIAGAAVITAVCALGAPLLGVSPLLPAAFPFSNPNHLAAFESLGAFVALGLALERTGIGRMLWVLGFSICSAVTILTLSRGGIAAFAVGAVAFAALERRVRAGREPGGRRSARGFLLVGIGIAAVIGAELALSPLLRELGSLTHLGREAKLQVWRDAARIIGETPLLGIGRSAFEAAYAGWKSDPARVTFTHVENQWLQAVVELGLPAGILLLGALILVWVSAARLEDLSTLELGMVAALAALAAHESVDFALHVPAVAIPAAIVLGLVTRGLRHVVLSSRGGFVAASALAAMLAACCAFIFGTHRIERDITSISRAPDARSSAAAAVIAATWHPADYLPHAAAGARWVAHGSCREAMPWLVRAMYLNPTAAEPHLLAARCLAASRRTDAARREYALAIAFGDPNALAEALQRLSSVDDLAALVPPTAEGLLLLGRALFGARPHDARIVFQRALGEHADSRALLPLAQLELEARNLDRALELAARSVAAFPGEAAGYEIAAAALLRLQRPDAAAEYVSRGLEVAPSDQGLLLLAIDDALRGKRFTAAHRLADRLPADTAQRLARKYRALAHVMLAQGRMGDAVSAARSACGAAPDDVALVEYLAELFLKANELTEAAATLDRAAAIDPARRTLFRSRAEELRELAAQRQDAPGARSLPGSR